MKKTLAIVLVVVMLASVLVACGSSGGSIIGTWTATQEGVTMEMTFENGGKGKVSTMGMSMDMEWSAEGNKLTASMSVMGQTQEMFKDAEFAVKGNELSITADGETVVFTKK